MKQEKKKRPKIVYSSSHEVFHMWAAQTQEYARQGGNRTRSFFRGKSCYSYGTHYEVGRLVRINGVQCALINTSGYSPTTGKHISEARSAVYHMPTIHVDNSFNWKQGILKMQDNLIHALFNKLNGRSFWAGSKAFTEYDKEDFDAFNKLCKVVGKPQLQLFPNKDTINVIDAHIKLALKRRAELEAYKKTPEYLEKLSEKQKQSFEKAERERAEMRERNRLEGVRRAVQDAAEIENWKQGGPFTYSVTSLHPQLIRVNGNNVETSSRATVSLAEACRALMHLENRKLQEGDLIGAFEFTSLKDDVVKIGCHELSLKQVKEVLSDKLKINTFKKGINIATKNGPMFIRKD